MVYLAALSNSDFHTVYSMETFTQGSRNGAAKCINILIIDDNVLEGNQTFVVTLTTLDSNVILENTVTTITIMDNDGQC